MVAPLILQDHVENETSNPYLKQEMLTFHRNQGDSKQTFINLLLYHQPEISSHQITGILPLLPICRESSKSTAMIKHLTDAVIKPIHYLNQSQQPVRAFDQPLNGTAKSTQPSYSMVITWMI